VRLFNTAALARDPPETGADCSDRRLHCEHGAESGLALRNLVVDLRCLCQWIRLHNRFNFSLRYEIKRFVKIFGAVLLAANYSNALRDASISETESGSASAPIVTSRPSGGNPCMLSSIDLVEFDVLRINPAPPAAARLLPSRTTSSAPRSRTSGKCKTTMAAAFAYCTAKCPSPPIPSTATRSCGLGSCKGTRERNDAGTGQMCDDASQF
jgi:hypothetical protein